MPTRRKSSKLKLVSGNPGKRPLKKGEVKVPLRCPTPPDFLSEEALVEWNRVVPQLYEAGVITDLDRAAVAAYCQAYGRWQQAERALAEMRSPEHGSALTATASNGATIVNPLVGIANKAKADFMRHAAQLGLTPVARTSVEPVICDDEDDPASEFFE